jgi:hypothetical protein
MYMLTSVQNCPILYFLYQDVLMMLVITLVLSSAVTVVTSTFLLFNHLSEIKVKNCDMATRFEIESLIPLCFSWKSFIRFLFSVSQPSWSAVYIGCMWGIMLPVFGILPRIICNARGKVEGFDNICVILAVKRSPDQCRGVFLLVFLLIMVICLVWRMLCILKRRGSCCVGDTTLLNKKSNSVGFTVEVTLLAQFNSHVNLNIQQFLMVFAVYRVAKVCCVTLFGALNWSLWQRMEPSINRVT